MRPGQRSLRVHRRRKSNLRKLKKNAWPRAFRARLHSVSCIFIGGEISMKLCSNYGCVAYGRVVYTQATRCVFCRWDLKPPMMKSESRRDVPARPEPVDTTLAPDSPTPPVPPHVHKRARLRPTA
jgi:hypothetical protein